MNYSFSPSINIVRDVDKPLYYLPTNNAKHVFNAIATNFNSGLHSFTIIGSYGTGKSAFLLALEKTLQREQNFFDLKEEYFLNCESFEFINIVGDYRSVIKIIGEAFNVEPNGKTIIEELKKKTTSNVCLVVSIDEFGKVLEFAAKNNADEELYFIQQLAELANDKSRNLLFITTLHQNFDAYALGLENTQRKEWEKVKGRLKELTFNEPVEQLLALAVERIKDKFKGTNKTIFPNSLLKTIKKNGIFPLRNELNATFVKKLFPFEPLAAAALTIALQRYGQNERSLFTFLDTKEYLGIDEHDIKENPFYNLSNVYDYLLHNFYSSLISRHNPDYFQWSLIRNSLERVDIDFEDDIESVTQLVKVIGLLNILGLSAAKINNDFLIAYGETCLKIDNVEFLLGQLTGQKIIRYRDYLSSYRLYEGSDIDIEAELENTRQTTDRITNLAYELKQYLDLEYATAKAVSYKVGTPRFFSYEISENPMKTFDGNEIDGFVNLVFSSSDIEEELKSLVGEPILYAVFQETATIKEQIFEIKAINKLFEKVENDDPAKRELQNLKDFRTQELRTYLLQALFKGEQFVSWYFNSEKIKIKSKTVFNKFLSTVCEAIYDKTPVLRNELMNRHKLSTSISSARKKLLERLINNSQTEDLGFTAQEFPPEKAIYFTLLKKSGLHRSGKMGIHYLTEPFENADIQTLWQASNDFLATATVSKKSINSFIQVLSEKPYKLKYGFIEFWIPIFLFIKKEEIAIYHNDRYIAFLNIEALDSFIKDSKQYRIKTFFIEGIKLELFNKYRQLIRQDEKDKVEHSTFLETIKPFIQTYKQLPNYTKNTSRVSDDAKAFRSSIKTAKELEKTFFEDLPTSFGYSLSSLIQSDDKLSDYIKRLRDVIRELNSTFIHLIERFEAHLLDELGFQEQTFAQYQSNIKKRYKTLATYLLTPQQKVFKARLLSPLDKRETYLNSLVSALIGKGLEQIVDSDEPLLHKKMIEAIRELDNLLEMANLELDEEKEQAVQIEITKFQQSPIRHKIILTKKQNKAVSTLKKKAITLFDNTDSKIVEATLIQLLEERLGK